MTEQERKIHRVLKKVEREMPKGYWLFAGAGTLHLMRTHPDGSRNIPGRQDSGMDPDLIVASYKTQCDGGDW